MGFLKKGRNVKILSVVLYPILKLKYPAFFLHRVERILQGSISFDENNLFFLPFDL